MGKKTTLNNTRKARPGTEYAAEYLFRPLAQLLVDPLARRKVNPQHVVLLHTLLGLYAAHLIHQGERVRPALLLQLKTVLDGLDGQLARATGQTTLTGRYLDTEMDLLVNLALNLAIEGKRGFAFTLLQSLILTVDYLWEQEYREARGQTFRAQAVSQDDHPLLLASLKGFYNLYFTPQEKLFQGLFEYRLHRQYPRPTVAQRQAYSPQLITQLAANLGLSSQFLWLGICVLQGQPRQYTRSLLWQATLLTTVQLWRERQPSSSGYER